ncbi:MAG: cysteine desulfurase [Clostridia bacterium]|nr:cysteine desulfurase [Clostridia bacterium]MBR3593921.1 cysteine desulfurase [Clostridia bacterium]
MNNTVYLDNSATTVVCDRAIEYINHALSVNYGNPSSLHVMGMQAEEELRKSRAAVAAMLSCREDEIFFTGSGTEANNTAVFGAARARRKRGNRIVTTAVEHPSVLEAVKLLEDEGFEVIRLVPDVNGKIREGDIFEAVNKDTVLVSIMLVNNETGALQPIKTARAAVTRAAAPALIHCDAVQGFGKMKISVADLGIDLLTASAHKIHGPKGVGILYKKKNVHIPAYIVGGGQESGLRSGTESVPLISGLRGAIEELPKTDEKVRAVRDYAAELFGGCGFAKINSPTDALPYIINISVPGYRSETLLHYLESKGIFVSSGSACAKGAGSYVLRAAGLSSDRVDSALRISFSRFNSKEDVDRLFSALKAAKDTLRSSK